MLAAEALHQDFMNIKWPAGTKPAHYYILANLRGNREVIGEFFVPKGPFAGDLPIPVKVSPPFIVAGSAAEMSEVRSVALYSKSGPDARMEYDDATSVILGAAGKIIYAMI